jgi:hypothetical protein
MTNARKMAALLNTDTATNARGNPTIGPKLTPRQHRALDAFWKHGSLMREALDRAAGCSNSPQLVADLKAKSVSIACELVDAIDRDGRRCKPGRYTLTNHGRATLSAWGWT